MIGTSRYDTEAQMIDRIGAAVLEVVKTWEGSDKSIGKRLGRSRLRVSHLRQGQFGFFTLRELFDMAARTGVTVGVVILDAPERESFLSLVDTYGREVANYEGAMDRWGEREENRPSKVKMDAALEEVAEAAGIPKRGNESDAEIKAASDYFLMNEMPGQ